MFDLMFVVSVMFLVVSLSVISILLGFGQWVVECVWNLMAHSVALEGNWRGNWRMEWVASTLTLPRNMVCTALLPLGCQQST